MRASLFARRFLSGLAAMLAVSCGNDTVAGKTTTTTNGGGGSLLAIGPTGQPLSGCVALAARSWDPVRGVPGAVDTLRGDANGKIQLASDAYAFVEIQDSSRNLGAWMKRVAVLDGIRRAVALDTLRALQGRWVDRSTISTGRILLDSSFRSASLGLDGSFAFEKVPTGSYALSLDADASTLRSMGEVRLESHDVRYTGSGNVIVSGDTTGSPLWIDDFESLSNVPRLHVSLPSVSPWYMWWVETDMIRPAANDGDSIAKAIGPDSTRPGNSFHVRSSPRSSSSWIALGLTGMELDLSARQGLCLAYRSDTALKIQLQRDSVGSVRPTLSAWLPASKTWRDACVATSSFVPNSDTPDSLRTWAAFGRRVLVVEFQSPGGTFFDLDDILFR